MYTWIFTRSVTNKLQVFINNCLRRILNVSSLGTNKEPGKEVTQEENL